MKATVINTLGKEVSSVELKDEIFGREYNEALIHQVIVAQLANKRQGTKSTLTRTEVRGGGRKPWRQKGTGRARQGSIRAPQWTHGGVVFAPKPRDFSKKINKQMRVGALCSALSKKLADGDLLIVDKFELEAPKTKLVATALNNIGIEKTALLIVNGHNEELLRASRNIQALTLSDVALLNVYELVRANKCVFTLDAINALMEVYA